MKKILVLLVSFVLLTGNCFAIVDWKQGTNASPLAGASNASDIDYGASNYLADPLDKLLKYNIRGCTLTRTSASVITVSAGEVTCMNGAVAIKRMRENTSTATMDMTVVGVGGIDSGSAEVVSTWYALYAVADANATTFTIIAAQQGTALSDATYYRYIGSVYNDSGSDLKNFYWFGTGSTPLIMWDVPVVITTTLSAGVWSGATSCSTGMPSTSTLAVFGLKGTKGADDAGVWIRPNGSTWSTNNENGTYNGVSHIGGQRICVTDSSQQIQYYNVAATAATSISVEGFYISR